jgi:dynein heavy chain, axonemal
VAQATTLRRLLDADILVHLPRITDLSDAASREASIEHALDKMLADWEGLAFELAPWKNTGTYILKGEDAAGAARGPFTGMRCSYS